MNINTNKLASSSNQFLKKLKESTSASKVDSSLKDGKTRNSKLLNDFFDIKYSNQDLKARLSNNNDRLTKYEYEVIKLQFLKENISRIDTLLANGEKGEIQKVVDQAIFDNQSILREYIKPEQDILSQLNELKTAISTQESELGQEFKKIQIASQNIVSTNSFNIAVENSDKPLANIDVGELLQSTSIDNKRVMDLIS